MQSFLQFLHTVISQLQPYIQRARATVESLLASPDRWIVYLAGAWIALLLIFIPLMRISARRRRRREELEERSYSVLGIGPTARADHAEVDDLIRPLRPYPRWADAAPVDGRPVSEPASNVTPIRSSATIKCTHCGGALSETQNFCPACGYAQPATHSVTA